jgi:hypothetical protein
MIKPSRALLSAQRLLKASGVVGSGSLRQARSKVRSMICRFKSSALPSAMNCMPICDRPGTFLSRYFTCSRSCSMNSRSRPARCALAASSAES